MNYTYLLVNLGAFLIPLIFTFHPKLRFDKTWKAFCVGAIVSLIPFIIWDALFTINGIWGFNKMHLLNINFMHLPIEEWLFFICVPYACVFTYHCLNIIIKKDHFKKFEKGITFCLLIFLITIATFHTSRMYTTTTFILLALLLFVLQFILKTNWLSRFYLSYLIILIPFFIVNGILTGTGIEQEVVWYDNNETLGIRLGTIPAEDIFYGMLLILMNITIYEWALRRKTI